MNAIILCGGLSTRLGDITQKLPKILLPIGNTTVLDWQLEKIKELGIEEVVLAAGHLAHELYTTVGNERNGISLVYAIEDKRLGTGGALRHGLEYIRNPHESTWVFNGDILTNANLSPMSHALRPESDGIILGVKTTDVSSYGTVVFDKDCHLVTFKEKEGKKEAGYVNGGVYVFTSRAQTYFAHTDVFSIEYDMFPKMKELYVYATDAIWIDVGVPERLAWARDHWHLFSSI